VLLVFCSVAWCDEAQDGTEAAPPAKTIAVFMPHLQATPEPGSNLHVAGWRHVVALGPKAPSSRTRPVILVSCQARGASATEKALVDRCAQQVLARVKDLRIVSASKVGSHLVQILEGPGAAVEGLLGTRPGPTVDTAKAEPGESKAESGERLETSLKVPEDWTVQFDETRGTAVAWPQAAPASKVRIEPCSVSGVLEEQAISIQVSAAESDGSAEQAQPRQPVATERVELFGSGSNGLQPLRVRFFPAPAPEGCDIVCDTGAVALPVPEGWELLYFEERLWVTDSSESSVQPAPWPWFPKASEPQAPEAGAREKGSLLVGARTGEATAAVVGCLSPAQPLDELAPAFCTVLEGLHLAQGPSERGEGASASNEVTLPDDNLMLDSPEWLDVMMAEQEEVLARNQAILEGREAIDPEAEAVMAWTEEAVQRLNEEILAYYPQGGDPPGWAQQRLAELLQETQAQEVTGQ
jgi:hypothetical protein